MTKTRVVEAQVMDKYVLAMDEDGQVSEYADPSALVAAVRRADAAAARRGVSTVTVIRWDAPEGFEVPE